MRFAAAWSIAVAASLILAARVARADDTASTRDGSATLSVEANAEGIELLDRTKQSTMSEVRAGRGWTRVRTPVFETLCERAPCDVSVATGEHVFAASKGGGDFVTASAPLRIDGPATLSIDYIDRTAVRTAGAVTLFATAIAGVAMIIAGHPRSVPCEAPATPSYSNVGPPYPSSGSAATCAPHVEVPAIGAAGIVTVLVGPLLGGVMMAMPDGVGFEVTPLTLGSIGAREGAASAALPDGLALTMRF